MIEASEESRSTVCGMGQRTIEERLRMAIDNQSCPGRDRSDEGTSGSSMRHMVEHWRVRLITKAF